MRILAHRAAHRKENFHSLIFIGSVDLGDGHLDPVVADITPSDDTRSPQPTELSLMPFVVRVVPADEASPEAAWAYRPEGLQRPQREAAARGSVHRVERRRIVADSRLPFLWRVPAVRYSIYPQDGWGPDTFYCSSYIATSYGLTHSDVLELPRLRVGAIAGLVDSHYATPDDLLNALPGMTRVGGFGPDGRGWSLWSPANLLITDPEGRRTGRDAEGTVYEEIPGALWRLNDDNESVSAPDVSDEWTVTVSGTGEGTYHLVMHAVGKTPGPVGGVEATTAQGKVDVYRVGDIPIGPAGASGPSGPPGAGDFIGTALLPALGLIVLVVPGAVGGLLLYRRRLTR